MRRFGFALLAAAALAWLQVWGARRLGVLNFDRTFDAGADNDWLLNYRNVLWLVATAVLVVVPICRAVFRSPDPWLPSVAALLGAGTVIPFLQAQAGHARDVGLVAHPGTSVIQAAIAGAVLGAVASVLVNRAEVTVPLVLGALVAARILVSVANRRRQSSGSTSPVR